MTTLSGALHGPRERAAREGLDALGNGELVALLLGTGRRDEHGTVLAERLLAVAGAFALCASSGPLRSPSSTASGR